VSMMAGCFRRSTTCEGCGDDMTGQRRRRCHHCHQLICGHCYHHFHRCEPVEQCEMCAAKDLLSKIGEAGK